ncbi:MAG: RING/Ubox like zinc-binding domain-containing protein [Benjaminiella poitrasii]|nr:MAG: RING/Ubox like zinc-binding domain-containing protein [Benjaminiella poitrasii]
MESDEEDLDCPLCMEEFDIADRNFKPCPCGYQICRFCWHHIRENLNGRCPACRREYSDEMVEFKNLSAQMKEKERQQKDMESSNRRHLSNMRVVQKNLVYIIGLHPRLAIEEISKVVINKRPALPASQISSQPSAAVYVTYYRKEDAAKAIAAVDGSVIADRVVRASYGTTKYCTYYLREDIDTISKEELATGTHHMRDMLSNEDDQEKSDHSSSRQASPKQQRPQLTSEDFPAVSASIKHMIKTNDDSALPASASWAKVGGTGSTPSTPVMSVSDAFGPTLSAAVAATQQKTQFPPMPKRKSEKKKRKEQQLQQQQQKALSETSSAALDEEKNPLQFTKRRSDTTFYF